MLRTVQFLITILQVTQIWNASLIRRPKRSPLDLRPSFANLPKFLSPQHIHFYPGPFPRHTSNHIQIIEKRNKNHLYLVPAAVSNMRHTSIHSGVKHILTSDNLQVPLLTHTLTHTTTNITHPSKIQFLLPIHPYNYHTFHDLSVIPLQRSNEPKNIDRDEFDENIYGGRFRKFYGGFGAGLTFGGHGAGHGFYSYP